MMSPERFIELCKPYWDGEGMFAQQPNPPGKWDGGNMLLDGSVYFVILKKLGHVFTFEDRRKFRIMIEKCWHNGIIGLLDRNPGRPDAQAKDDYTGVMSAARLLDPWLARKIFRYGYEHAWCFNNLKPKEFKFRFWHDRFIGQVAHYYNCASEPMPLTRAIGLKTALVFSASTEDASSIIQDWLKVDALKTTSCTRNYWEAFIFKNWGDMGRVMTKFHGEKHPFSIALRGII